MLVVLSSNPGNKTVQVYAAHNQKILQYEVECGTKFHFREGIRTLFV